MTDIEKEREDIQTLVFALMASKSWMRGYAEAFVADVIERRPGSERVVSVGELEALCDEWEAEVRLRSYTEARPLLEELRTLIAKAGVGDE